MLRKEGASVQKATSELEGQSIAYKNELLFQHGINFDTLPSWQKRGIGLWWTDVPKEGYNPKTGETVLTTRRGIFTEYELPLRENSASFVENLLKTDI